MNMWSCFVHVPASYAPSKKPQGQVLLLPALHTGTSVTSWNAVVYDLQDSTLLDQLSQICGNITFNDSSGNPLVCQGFAYDSTQKVAFFKGQAANKSIDQSYLCHQPNITLWLLNAGQLSSLNVLTPAGMAPFLPLCGHACVCLSVSICLSVSLCLVHLVQQAAGAVCRQPDQCVFSVLPCLSGRLEDAILIASG